MNRSLMYLIASNIIIIPQLVIIPIWKSDEEKATVLSAAASVEKHLKSEGLRTKLDASEQRTPGWKFNFWEMKVLLLSTIQTILRGKCFY